MRSYLDAENTSQSAEFNTDCIRLVKWDGMTALPYHSPTAAEREKKPVTVKPSAELIDEYSAELQNRHL